MSIENRNAAGNRTVSDLIAWTPKQVTAVGAGSIVVKRGSGEVARLLVETAGVAVALYDDDVQVWAALTGVDEDEFAAAPLFCGESIVLNFSGAGTAYILFR